MKEVNEDMFFEAVEFLHDNLENIFRTAEVVLLWFLGKNIKKGVKNTTSEPAIVKAADQKTELSDPAPVTTSAPKTVKKQLSAQLLSDLELLFSDKDDADLTEDEKTRISALTSYLLEVKK